MVYQHIPINFEHRFYSRSEHVMCQKTICVALSLTESGGKWATEY
jgi:hypothetical protein